MPAFTSAVAVVSSRSPITLSVTRAGAARGDRDRHGVARLVFRLVERDFQQVRRVGAGFGVEAGIEADRGQRRRRVAGSTLRGDSGPRLTGSEMRPGLSAATSSVPSATRRVDLDRLIVPAAVAGGTIDSASRSSAVRSAARCRASLLAVRRDDDDVEAGIVAFAERAAGEQRLDADHVARRARPAASACARRRGRRLPPCARRCALPAGASPPAPCRARPRTSPCRPRRSPAGRRADCCSGGTLLVGETER